MRKIPTLRKLVVTNFPGGREGKPFRFKVRAFNLEGYRDSAITSYLLAGVPATPTVSPQLVQAETNITHVTVTLPLIADADNGNSAIISYQLDIDDGQGGTFSPVGGYDPLSLVTKYSISQGIVRGRTYRLRYRTLNGVGYSLYSPLLYATAAGVPTAPPSPTLKEASANSITLNLFETEENGGSKILYYEIHMDEGSLNSAFDKIESYDGKSATHIVKDNPDGLISGLIFAFKYRAINVVGPSPFSPEVRFAVAQPPTKPNTPTRAAIL